MNRYINTGRLIVRVEKDNLPIENAKIVVRSRFLMETNPMYKGPLVCMVNYSDRYGTCVFNLGVTTIQSLQNQEQLLDTERKSASILKRVLKVQQLYIYRIYLS